MSAALVAALAVAVAVLVGGAPRTVSSARLDPATRPPARGHPPGRGHPSARSGRLAAGLAGLALVAVLPMPLGLIVGGVTAAALPGVLSRLEPAATRRERALVRRDLPLGADLFAACVLGGADPAQAATVVADAVGGPLAVRLAAVSRALRLGVDPAQAWAGLSDDPALVGWARTCARAASTGAPLGAVVSGIAVEARARRRASAAAAARRAAVRATMPLGLCFLPAFVLVGVVPLIGSFVVPLLDQLT